MLIQSIYTDETVRRSVLNSLGYLLLYLIGLNILLPFVPPELVSYPGEESSGSLAGLLYEMHQQSSFIHYSSILTLGAWAYYLASVIVFLLAPVLYRERAGKEQSIQRLVKGLTLGIATLQAFSYSELITHLFLGGGDTWPYAFELSWLALVSGALICMWIADKISAQGLLDGRILLVCVALFSSFPTALVSEVSSKLAMGQLLQLGVEIGGWLVVVAGLIALTQAVRYLPLKIKEKQGEEELENPHLRLRLNMVDEYPLTLAQQVIGLPMLLLPAYLSAAADTPASRLMVTLSDPTSPITLLLTFGLIVLATYAVVRLVVRPRQYTAFLQQWDATISDVPTETAAQDFFHTLFDRLTFPLAIALAVIGILPGIAMLVFDLEATFAAYFGGFSLFLIVSLLTDFFSKLEQLATESSMIVGRGTTPELELVYELEVEEGEEE